MYLPYFSNNRKCKKVKFKASTIAINSNSLSIPQQNGSNEQSNVIMKSRRDCQCNPSFNTLNFNPLKLLTFLLILSSCIVGIESSAIDDLYRDRASRVKRDTENEEIPEVIVTRPDTVCNQGGPTECVCNRSLGDYDDKLVICDRLLEEKTLTVVSLVMRNINLNVKLHTNEPYQQYFRRRIANIVSQYCEKQANECPGAILQLNRNNVIIIRVNYLERQRTEIQMVVSKESMTHKLNDGTLIDSKKVKNILGAQLAPLSRVLGGVQIEKLRLVEIDRRKVPVENRKLLTLLLIVSTLMGSCYVIACVKVCRDSIEKRRAAKENNAMLNDKDKRNYGTCTDKLLSCEAPNGKVKSKSITSRTSATSKDRKTSSGIDQRSTTHSSKRSNNNNEDLTSITIDINKQDISQSQQETSPASGATDSRSFQRMFACDLSQLPAESVDLIDDQDPDAVFLDESEPFEPTSPKYNNNGYNYVENVEVHNGTAESIPNVNNRRPPVVPIVIASGSQFSIDKEPSTSEVKPGYMHQDSSDSVGGINQYFQSPLKSPLLSAIGEDSFARPLSRRGSRESTPEQGEEEYADNISVESVEPTFENPQNEVKKAPKLPNPEITFDQSSSESEDESNEVYHKLDEEELNKEKPKTSKVENYSSESDGEKVDEVIMLDRHAYERLEESPLPSPSVYNNNTFVDGNSTNTAILKKKGSEDMVNDLNEQIPSDYEEDLR